MLDTGLSVTPLMGHLGLLGKSLECPCEFERVSGVGWERLLVALEIVTESVGARCIKDCFLVSQVHKSIN